MHPELPRAPRLPVVGSALHYFADPLGFLERTARLGDVVHMRFAGYDAWLVSDPALIEQVLVKQASNFRKDYFLRSLQRSIGDGLLTSEGDFWKRQRRLAQPAFHHKRIVGYAELMARHASLLADKLLAHAGARVDAHEALMQTTADIVVQALFGADAGDTREVAECIDTLMKRFSDPLFLLLPQLERLPLPSNRRVREVAPRLDAIVQGFIDRRHALGDAAPDHDLLAMLLGARDEDGSRMSDKQVRDEVLILYLAGHETTALALSWALYLLAKHPGVEAKLHEELDAVLAGRTPGFEDLPRLEYTDRVVREVLRLYPPAWSMGREAKGEFELGGRRFAAGSWVWMIPWVVHHDPRWFHDPYEFLPDRWLEAKTKANAKFAYFPFGGGPRICIGNQFAMMEAVLVLATLAQRARFRLAPDARVVPDPAITLRFKHGLPMHVERRAAAPSRT